VTSQELHPALSGLRLDEGRDHAALALHWPDAEQRRTATDVIEWAVDRLAFREGRTNTPDDGEPALPPITARGIGASDAWAVLRDRVLTTAFPTDHPRYLAFVGGAASVTSVLADMAVSAAGVYAGSQLEAGAVVTAERAALRWLADLIGMPAQAHGAFVSGGSMANLSALVVARNAARRWGRKSLPSVIVAGATGHSSIVSAAAVMGCRVVTVGETDQPLQAADVRKALRRLKARKVVAVAATAGATNTGAIDDLTGIAEVCAEHGVWLHVDAAYGGAALLSERTRGRFAGIELADSVTIDPHKWLFTPFDCGAVLYREPALARATHAQTAAYLDVVSEPHHDNPSDYALHLSRRARGLPLWMSLLAHGTTAYRRSIEACLDVAEYAARRIRASDLLNLAAEPSLSVVVFQRRGWTAADYAEWSDRARRAGLGLVTPTTVSGKPALRFCFVSPQTSAADVDLVLGELGVST
jgi:L-2,4-diaminobutyrate decarboxylase